MSEEKSAAELAAEMEANGVDAVLGGRPDEGDQVAEGDGEQATDSAAESTQDEAGQQSQADAQAPAPAADATAATEVEAPIAGGGGKVIPYAVLKETRQRAHDALQEVERLRAELAAARAATPAPAAAAADEADGEDPYAELPDVLANKLRSIDQKQAELDKAYNTLRQRELQQQQAEQQSVAEQTQAVIDAIPDLAAWQAKGGPEWQAAVAADNRLMNSPAWANKPLAERIAKAYEIAALELGVSPTARPITTPPTARKAAAALPVTSLTDIAGGGMPAVDNREYIEGASAAQLAARLHGMSSDEIDRLLRETG